MTTPTTPTTPRTLALSPEEAAVCKLLIDAAQEIDKDKPEDDRLVLRFTGGWVRDKLLGTRSVDIDVGINNMSGYNFAIRLSEYISANMEKYGFEPRNVNKIESNPEKSKHLETATTKILGLDIDFVNLRSETYSEDSRIPHMVYSTLSSTVIWEILTAALGIRNPRKRCPPPRQHHQRPLLQPTH